MILSTSFKLVFESNTTIDNIFILNCLIDIFKSQHKKLYCAFIDLKAAFDKIDRQSLWSKLSLFNISGTFLNVVKKIHVYENAKSCAKVNTYR